MASTTNDTVKDEMATPHHSRHVSEQPIDRHSVEITDKLHGVFLNAGIDSTWSVFASIYLMVTGFISSF